MIHQPPKGVLQKPYFKPHARVANNYNIIENLAITPLAMLVLEVLKICPTLTKLPLLVIGEIDP